jgi:hypothetical protein
VAQLSAFHSLGGVPDEPRSFSALRGGRGQQVSVIVLSSPPLGDAQFSRGSDGLTERLALGKSRIAQRGAISLQRPLFRIGGGSLSVC